MTPTLARVTDRVRRLVDTLIELRVRVAKAVAGEVSRAVGEAARDLVAAALGDRPNPPPYRQSAGYHAWADEDDDYDDYGHVRPKPAYDRYHDDDEIVEPPPAGDADPRPPWPAVVAVGAAAAQAWAGRSIPAWVAAGTTALAVLAASLGGPVARAVLAAATAAGELLPLARDPD